MGVLSPRSHPRNNEAWEGPDFSRRRPFHGGRYDPAEMVDDAKKNGQSVMKKVIDPAFSLQDGRLLIAER
jgi:hypothetical protein